MSDTDALLTMLYWVLGMIIVIIIIDWLWLKPYQENHKTDQLIQKLRQQNTEFYQRMPEYTVDKGVVMVMDDTMALSGSLLIITLRKQLCGLPIIVYYTGDDLSAHNRAFMEQISGVRCIELSQHLNIPLKLLRGAQARVYAMIFSPFKQVLLLEPDILLLKNPEYLFQDPNYQRTGALFWKDCKKDTIWDKKVYDWVRKLLPYRKGDNRILDKKAGNFQSRDIMLLNKPMHPRMLEKLWTLTNEWKLVYKYIFNDKESYWIAAELAKEPYTFVSSYPGVVGEIHLNELCGNILYSDPLGNLLGWNGSLLRNGVVADFTHYALFDNDAYWKKVLGVSATNKCLQNANHKSLPPELLHQIN